jgi:hemoglobin/transferrin/lactoferrin receptor protein
VTTAVDVNETSLSPKLGVLYHATDAATLFLQYAHGFRAPPFADVNIGLDNPRFNYRAIPNPDLKSEKSDGLELGARFASARVHASASLFGADYDDFIESKVNLGPDPVTGVLIFQSRNVAQARIYGAEFDSDVDLDPYVRGVSIGAAGNWTHGENRDTHKPLDSVDPPELVLHARWAARDSFALALMTTLVAGAHRVDQSNANLFQPESFATVDVLATFEPMSHVRFDAGVFNLFDATYWRWSAVRGRPQGDPMIPALSAPGRYGSVSLHVDL